MHIRIFIAFLITLAAFHSSSGQCSCGYVTPDSEHVEIVFDGKIVKRSAEDKAFKYEIEISEIFRGLDKRNKIDVFDSFYNCGDPMFVDRAYLFMAAKDQQTQRINIVSCSYSSRNKFQQKQMIEILRWKKTLQDNSGILVGKVVSFIDGEGNSHKPEGVDKIHVESSTGKRYEAVIGADGFYKIDNLTKDRYKVVVNLPDTLTTYGDKYDFDNDKSVRYVNILEQQGAIADFSILTNARIGGRVFDSQGRPVNSINVNLLRIEGENIEDGGNIETDESGQFTFIGLTEGKYLIRVGFEEDSYIFRPNSLEELYPTTFFPDKGSQKDAKVIRLDRFQVLNEQNITLLPQHKKRIVAGRVLMPDGRPAAGARVSLQRKRKDGSRTLRSGWTSWQQSDSEGQFSFEALEETEYLMRFYVGRMIDSVRLQILYSSNCSVLPINGRIEPMRITLAEGDLECDEKKYGF